MQKVSEIMEDKKNVLKRIADAIFNQPKLPLTKSVERSSVSGYRTLFTDIYNGEKNLGEMGPIKVYAIDTYALGYRSWQSYIESEVTQTVINKFATWVIGKGLKLQSEPDRNILAAEDIKIDTNKFSQAVESRFNIYKKSRMSSFSNMKSVDLHAKNAFINSIVGGDVLVVLRYINKQVKVQLIDGAHVQSPGYGTQFFPQNLENGNKLINGIEIKPSGEHVRYYVRQADCSYLTISARGENTGILQAFLICGLEYRLDTHRGLPLFAAVMETLKKLERYKEATVGSAEERQKIPYFFEHGTDSNGENPMAKSLAKAFDADGKNEDLPEDIRGNKLADKVAATTNKMVFNLPQDVKISTPDSKNELYFKDFYTVNIDLVCAALGIPPEVAMSKYDSNFSASRAAIKDWENTLNVKRSEFSFNYYQNIYNFWFYTQVLENKIQAPGYLKAINDNDEILVEAYLNARFTGAPVPHIDPLKEVNAARLKLGESAKNIPLSTVESVTEDLNGGDSFENILQYSEEYKYTDRLGIPLVEPPAKPKES
jgi:capsid protein